MPGRTPLPSTSSEKTVDNIAVIPLRFDGLEPCSEINEDTFNDVKEDSNHTVALGSHSLEDSMIAAAPKVESIERMGTNMNDNVQPTQLRPQLCQNPSAASHQSSHVSLAKVRKSSSIASIGSLALNSNAGSCTTLGSEDSGINLPSTQRQSSSFGIHFDGPIVDEVNIKRAGPDSRRTVLLQLTNTKLAPGSPKTTTLSSSSSISSNNNTGGVHHLGSSPMSLRV